MQQTTAANSLYKLYFLQTGMEAAFTNRSASHQHRRAPLNKDPIDAPKVFMKSI